MKCLICFSSSTFETHAAKSVVRSINVGRPALVLSTEVASPGQQLLFSPEGVDAARRLEAGGVSRGLVLENESRRDGIWLKSG